MVTLARFFATLKACGAACKGKKHCAGKPSVSVPYSDVSAFVNTGQTLVMTGKDAVSPAFADENWWYFTSDARSQAIGLTLVLNLLIR
ncbi:hypothetical protein ACNKHK_05835 [Shigella flexneri]